MSNHIDALPQGMDRSSIASGKNSFHVIKHQVPPVIRAVDCGADVLYAGIAEKPR